MTSATTPWLIRWAAAEESGEALAILREAAQWLIDTGRPLWQVESLQLEAVRRAARGGELVLGFAESQPVATMMLQARDDFHWPNDPPGEALYVHKVAVRRCAAGQHWSSRLTVWARDRARISGARFLRLDTACRPELLSLYQRLGFYVVDERPRLVDGLAIHRLEQPIGDCA
jgi:ribosomal protein S18 acetylase RimI-like enzyme